MPQTDRHSMRHAQPSHPGGGVNDDGAGREGSASPAAATETVTVGQALQAVALSPAGGRPVDRVDASAIQAVEKSATGLGRAVPGLFWHCYLKDDLTMHKENQQMLQLGLGEEALKHWKKAVCSDVRNCRLLQTGRLIQRSSQLGY